MIWQILAILRSSPLLMATPQHKPPMAGDQPSTNAYVTLACGILSWILLPLIVAVVGAFIGRSELKAIREGRSPAAGETITKAGYWICIANIVFSIFAGCATVALVIAISAGMIGVASLPVIFEGLQQ